jgi:hypothetical protein
MAVIKGAEARVGCECMEAKAGGVEARGAMKSERRKKITMFYRNSLKL